jgi:predicted transposase YdaD
MARSAQEVPNPIESRGIIDMITAIVGYKFTHLSRQEVDVMLGVRLQETRVYQEAREENLARCESIGVGADRTCADQL